MRVVLDTNVLVRAYLKKASISRELVDRILMGEELGGFVVLYDRRIMKEWREVLVRPKFSASVTKREVAQAIRRLGKVGEKVRVRQEELPELETDDPTDLPFMEVAIAGEADAVVTFNTRHFPRGQGFEVARPDEVLRARGRRKNPLPAAPAGW